MEPVVADFIDWAQRVKRATNTINRYKAVLAQIPGVATADQAQIEAWWETRKDMAAATQENELACLRTFYKWAIKFDHRIDDPTRRLTAPKVDNAFPRPIARAELQRAFDLCDERDAPDLRRAIALGAYGGLRVSEAATLTWKAFDLETHFMRIKGKGSKTRIAGVSPLLLDEVLPALDENVNVVTGRPDKAYTADTLQRRVNRLLEKVHPELTFHKCRARYVTQAIARTGDIFTVAKAVGWASIETAQHYAEISDDALQRVAAAAAL